MNNDLYEKTKELLKQLNYFIIHVVLYFFVNIGLVLLAFRNISGRWWLFFFVFAWAMAVLYHGLRVYGVDLFRKNKHPKLMSWFFTGG